MNFIFCKINLYNREALLELKNSLSQQTEKETDPATILHVGSMLIYCTCTNSILNAPGKCVPFILDSLKAYLNEETHGRLIELQSKCGFT